MHIRRTVVASTAVLALIFGVVSFATINPAQAAASQKVAFVPSDSGQAGNGGTLPTAGFPGGYAPTFTDVSLASIRDGATDPLPAFDTVVLVQVCDIGTYLGNTQFRTRLENFVKNGGKLIIWDSECASTDYSKFLYPFTTNNPGAMGESGTLTIAEQNALGNSSPASPQYVDVSLVSSDTDAVGDANVFVTKDQDWCVAMNATNSLGVNGPVVNYARAGTGLIFYTGLDMDVLSATMTFDPTSTAGDEHLARIWMNQLQASSNLPCGVLAYGLTLTPPTATLAQGATHTLTATMFDNGVGVPGVTVTFSVTGANAGITGTGVTDADGKATFSYKGTNAGNDTVTASGAIPGAAPIEKTATVTWTAPSTPPTTSPAAQAPAVAATPAFTG
jgi:hypothetical protein